MAEAPGETLGAVMLEAVMLEAKAVEGAIDTIAYRVYGAEEHRANIEEVLKSVL